MKKKLLCLLILLGTTLSAQSSIFSEGNIFRLNAPVWFERGNSDHAIFYIANGSIQGIQNHNGDEMVFDLTSSGDLVISYNDYSLTVESVWLNRLTVESMPFAPVITDTNYKVLIDKQSTNSYSMSIELWNHKMVSGEIGSLSSSGKTVSHPDYETAPFFLKSLEENNPSLFVVLWDFEKEVWFANFEMTNVSPSDTSQTPYKYKARLEVGRDILKVMPCEGVFANSEEWKYLNNLIKLQFLYEGSYKSLLSFFINGEGVITQETMREFTFSLN